MRLFAAILLSNPVKDELMRTVENLRPHVLDGRFTRRENLHLTLAFLGETGNLKGAKRALHTIQSPAFEMVVEGLGRFRRDGGDILWAGVRKNARLFALADRTQEAFGKEGFVLEKRPFAAHLTLGRQILLRDKEQMKSLSNLIESVSMPVEKVSLMCSDRVQGRLTYTELDFVVLNKKTEIK